MKHRKHGTGLRGTLARISGRLGAHARRESSAQSATGQAHVASVPQVMTLARLPFGIAARVLAVGGSDATARRLMEMGLVPGAPVLAVKSAPLGDPIEIRVLGYSLALRRCEAESIRVTVGVAAGVEA